MANKKGSTKNQHKKISINAIKYNADGDPFLESFAIRLNEYMYDKNISQMWLSKETGLGEGSISKYRNGLGMPKAFQLTKLAEALKVSTDYLLGLSDAETNNMDLIGVYEYTGLSVKAIKFIRLYYFELQKERNKNGIALDMLSALIANQEFAGAIRHMGQYIQSIEKSEMLSKNIEVREESIDDYNDSLLDEMRKNRAEETGKNQPLELWNAQKEFIESIENIAKDFLKKGEYNVKKE